MDIIIVPDKIIENPQIKSAIKLITLLFPYSLLVL